MSFDSRDDFEAFLDEHQYPKFTHPSLDGSEERELCQKGSSTYLTFDNREDYVALLTKFRLEELQCRDLMNHVRAGMAAVVPADTILGLLTPDDLEGAVCGAADSPQRILTFLRRFTTYQAGLTETDEHVTYFWSALDSLSPTQLKGFIKFACNQERLPIDAGQMEEGMTPPPPYPMKIAPTDTR